jgi:hypothetical protein
MNSLLSLSDELARQKVTMVGCLASVILCSNELFLVLQS